MTQVASDNIEYNTMGTFQASDCNTHGYYIVKWTGNAYTLQEKYKCHAFDPPVIICEGELVCPDKFMTPMIKTSHWYHNPNKSIPFMVKLKKLLCFSLIGSRTTIQQIICHCVIKDTLI